MKKDRNKKKQRLNLIRKKTHGERNCKKNVRDILIERK